MTKLQFGRAHRPRHSHGGTHAGEFGISHRPLEHRRIRGVDGLSDGFAVCDARSKCFDCGSAGNLAAAMPPDTIGDSEQFEVFVDDVRIFVNRSHEPDVGDEPRGDVQRITSISLDPMLMWSPRFSLRGSVIWAAFT